jgi:peptidoglycan/xylan/chitin deacetylase (PgdA/CDA1 family)
MTSRYPREWEWPDRAKIAMSVGIAFEAFERRSQFSTESGPNKVDYFSLSYAEYGAKSGVWRLLDLMDELGLKASFSTNGLAAERHPNVMRELGAAGHEVVGHGWVNDELHSDDDPDREVEQIKRCVAALSQSSGMRPVGWTSPGSVGSKNTLDFLRQEGFIWNGDDASDDLPFLTATQYGPIVTMPRTNIPQNDLIMWVAPRNPPSVFYESFRDTFDQLYAEGANGSPKWIEMTLHCHMAGRPTLIPTIRKCVAYARQHQGVWFARKRDIAEWALQRLA